MLLNNPNSMRIPSINVKLNYGKLMLYRKESTTYTQQYQFQKLDEYKRYNNNIMTTRIRTRTTNTTTTTLMMGAEWMGECLAG